MKPTTGLSLTLKLVALLLMTAGTLLGQIEVGRVMGTVTDRSGAVINNAKVTLTNVDTGVSAVTGTTASGLYAFPAVQPGRYTLRVESTGFTVQVTNDVIVHVQGVNSIDLKLSPSRVLEQVVVNSTPPLLQTEDAEVGQVIDASTVDDMPLNGRAWSSLGMLAAGVNTPPASLGNGFEGGNPTPGSTFFSANGQNLFSNDYRLNGVGDMLEFYNGAPAIQPPPESIAEFKLENGDYSAEFGHSTGPVVNAVVKSGTNKLHGDLFDYFRNDALDARDYFTAAGTQKAELRYNQFGGTIGGPIYLPQIYDGRKKSFFFFDYQELKALTPTQYLAAVPTNLMQSSNFTNLKDLINFASGTNTDLLGRAFPNGTVLDPATTRSIANGAVDPVSGLTNTSGGTVFVRDPFYSGSLVGLTDFTQPAVRSKLNMIPGARIDQNALKLMQLFPAATNPAVYYSGNYFKNYKITQTNRQYDIRIDHNFNDRNTVTGFYSWSKTDSFQPSFLPGVLDGDSYYNGDTLNPHWSANGSYTHVFSPTLTNEFRLGYGHQYRSIENPFANTAGIPAEYGIQGVPQIPGNGGLPIISISGLTTIGPSGWTPTLITAHNLQIIDNLTKLYGRHLFKMGVDVNDIEGDITQPTYGRGDFDFNGQFTDVPNQNTGLTGLGQFLVAPGANLLGGPDGISASGPSGTRDHRWYIAGYFQDDFKVSGTLTLNLGLRYDLFTPYAEVDGRQANFVPNNGNGPGGTYFIPQTSCGTPTNPAFQQLLATDGIATVCAPGLSLGVTQKKNFAPRIGFAKRITPNYVLRGGFGITYSPLESIGYGPNLGQNYPFQYTVGYGALNSQSPLRLPDPFTGAVGTLETGLTNINPEAIAPQGLGLAGRAPYAQPVPYTETYNLTNQYQFTANDSIQLAYVGSASRHLTNLYGANAPNLMLIPGTALHQSGGPNFIPFPDFGGVSVHIDSGISSYNSGQFTYQHHFSYGLQLLGNYTYSRCLTDASPQTTGLGYRAPWLPGFGIRGDYTNCPVAVTSVIHLSGMYKLPFGPKMRWQGNRVTNAVLGGWQLNWIYTYQSGDHFGVGCTVGTLSGMGCNSDQSGDAYAGARKVAHWLNASAFSNPAIPTAAEADANGVLLNQRDFSFLGNTRDMAFVGPAWYNIDMSLFKEFPVGESTHFQFRAESFDILNHPQFNNPSDLNFSGDPNFGIITSTRNPGNGGRVLQLALKLYF